MSNHQAVAGYRHPAPLTFKVGEVADVPVLRSATGSPAPRRCRPSAATIVEAIAADAARAARQQSAVVVTVPPAIDGDPTLMFLRCGGQTQLMIGVPREIIRSPRLRGDNHHRDRDAEREFELMRVAEAKATYEAEADDDYRDDPDDDDDDFTAASAFEQG